MPRGKQSAEKDKCPRCRHSNGDHRPVVNGQAFCYSCMDSPCWVRGGEKEK